MADAPSISLEVLHRRSVIILTVLAVFTALKLAAPVLMPLAVAIFLIALAWPIKVWLSKRLPDSLSYAGSFIALAAVLGIFVGSLWLSAAEIIATLPAYKSTMLDMVNEAKEELALNGVETSRGFKLEDFRETITDILKNFQESLFYLIMVTGYVMLALPEAARWKPKLRACLNKEESDKLLDTALQLGQSLKTYLIAMLIAGGISAVATWFAAKVTGLDFALTWGILAFLMNFIPTIGAIIMIIPPTLFAFVQFQDPMMPLVVLAVFGVIQLFVGMVVDSKLQGGMLSISPVVILFSLAFWGFLWGIPGALLATPLTHTVIIVCTHYERTKWIACLLSERKK